MSRSPAAAQLTHAAVMFWNHNRHPILQTWGRINRPFARVSYNHHQAFFRALVDSDLHIPAVDPAGRPGADEPIKDDELAPLEMEHELGRIAVACLDAETVTREFADATGAFEMSGSAVCRAVRDDDYVAMAIFGPRRGEAELSVDWAAIEWLGAGLLPWMYRLTGRRKVLRLPGLTDACRSAIRGRGGLEMAELYQGVGLDGVGRAIVSLRPETELSPIQWFALRRSVESAIADRGHDVPVVHEPMDVWVQDEPPSESNRWASPAIDLLEPDSDADVEDPA